MSDALRALASHCSQSRKVFLRKGLGVDLQLLSNREKTLLIDALKEHYDLPELLGQLGLARSSYFY
ncbi:hypothetical protein, partial [Serratia marcescens]|uniref:hypothetical protein n=1 Tax=Serratia marcescens TaxID=615 RepID=UPI0019543E5D